jgi:uncharacterized repeat protein (TIGR01451 family)
MRSVLTVLATAVSTAVLTCGVAEGDTVTTDFEGFTAVNDFNIAGTVNGQDGWTSAVPGDIPLLPFGYDQRVRFTNAYSKVPGAFGSKSLRHSNAFNEPTAEFFYQTYSKPTAEDAGENLPFTEYLAEFSFISTQPDAQQPGLHMRISPDLTAPSVDGSRPRRGARMSFIGLRDIEGDDIALTFVDTDANGDFKHHDAGLVRRDVVHTIKFWIKLNADDPDTPEVEEERDLVRLYIDGVEDPRCFTTWENFYPRVNEEVPTINTMQFRSSGPNDPDLAGGGYLFDNVTITTGNGLRPEGSRGCGAPDVVVDKTTQTQFAEAGDLITYRLTVTNRGDAAARSLRLCDVVPRALRFVRATARLERAAGRRLCLPIRLLRAGQSGTFRATFRLRANVTADTVTNGANVDTPAASVPSPSPDRPVRTRRRRRARDAATVGVTRPAACPAALSPRARAAC